MKKICTKKIKTEIIFEYDEYFNKIKEIFMKASVN